MTQYDHDIVAKRSGIAATLLYLVVLICALWFTQCESSPQITEEQLTAGSIEIAFGESDDGAGDVAESEPAKVVSPPPTPEPQPEEPPVLTDESSDVEQEIPDEQQEQQEPTPPREVNNRALFPGTKSNNNTSRGESKQRAIVGSDRGTSSTATNISGGLSGDFDLAGRSLTGSLPVPQYDEQQEGRVVMNITVDDGGYVTSASLKADSSTTNNSTLIEAARQAALKARFSPSEEFIQSGTITYIFKLN